MIPIKYKGYYMGRSVEMLVVTFDDKGYPFLFNFNGQPLYANKVQYALPAWSDFKTGSINLTNELIEKDIFKFFNVTIGKNSLTVKGDFPIAGNRFDTLTFTETEIYGNTPQIKLNISDEALDRFGLNKTPQECCVKIEGVVYTKLSIVKDACVFERPPVKKQVFAESLKEILENARE